LDSKEVLIPKKALEKNPEKKAKTSLFNKKLGETTIFGKRNFILYH